MTKSYKDLKMYQASYELAIQIHKMSMALPKHELYEMGSQIRRASKSICLNIAEGYGRRRYKNEFIQFLTYSLASCDETREILHLLYDTGSFSDKSGYENLILRCNEIGRMISAFIRAVETEHKSKR
jgi:four helix bundle protein